MLPAEIERASLHGIVISVMLYPVGPSAPGPVARIEVVVLLHEAEHHVVRGRKGVCLEGEPERMLRHSAATGACELRGPAPTRAVLLGNDVVRGGQGRDGQ